MIKKVIFILVLLFVFKAGAQSSVLKVADSLLQSGDYKSALAKLTSYKNPNFAVLQKTGRIYQRVGNYSKAIQYYDKAYVMQASDKIKEEIGRCYQALGNNQKAIAIYKEVLEANPKNLLLKYQLARLYMGSRKTKAAAVLMKELIAEDAKNPNYHYQLGVIYNKQKKDASKPFLKAYELDNKHIKTIHGLAKFFKVVKVRDSSGIFIDKGLALMPNNLNFLQLKAQHEYLEKEYDSTLVYLKKLETLKFETAFTMKLFGLSYYNLKDYEKALTYFKKGSRIDRQDTDFVYKIALCQYQLKDFRKAQMNFMMVILLDTPDLSDYYFHLAQTCLALKNPKRAIKALEEGLKNKPRDENLQYHLALVSDSYYKDKKLVLKRYEDYVKRHEDTNKERMNFANERVKEIKKALFIKGEKSE